MRGHAKTAEKTSSKKKLMQALAITSAQILVYELRLYSHVDSIDYVDSWFVIIKFTKIRYSDFYNRKNVYKCLPFKNIRSFFQFCSEQQDVGIKGFFLSNTCPYNLTRAAVSYSRAP